MATSGLIRQIGAARKGDSMSAVRESQLSINTKRVLTLRAKWRLLPHNLMADISLLPASYDAQIVRGANMCAPDQRTGEYPSTKDSADGGFVMYECDVCFHAYHHVLAIVEMRKDRRVTYKAVLASIRALKPQWTEARAIRIANYFWWELTYVVTFETPTNVWVDRQVESLAHKQRMRIQ